MSRPHADARSRPGPQGRAATARHSRDAVARRRRDAFTMLELLVVMGIMAVLAAVTAASYVGVTRRASREGARADVMGVLRQARISAVDTGRGAVVRIDPATRTIYGISTDVIGAWHFEEIVGGVTPGARRYDGAFPGTTPGIVPGQMGLAFRFNGTSDFVDCSDAPIWNQTTGVRIEAWVRPDADVSHATQDKHIISKMGPGGAFEGYFIGLQYDVTGALTAFEAGFAVPGAVGGFAPDAVFLQTPGTYSAGQWHSVAAEFDGFEARLFVDGVLAASDAAADGLNAEWNAPGLMRPARGSHLNIGYGTPLGGPAYFAGAIDEPRVLSVAGGSPVTLPERVPLVTSDPAVHYDAQGFLNLAYHSGPVSVTLGDPYQAAELSGPIGAGDLTLSVRPTNPFPTTGGLVLIVATNPLQSDEVICGDAAGLNLNNLVRGQYGTAPSAHDAGDKVYFARVIQVDTTGLVTRP
jgi:prepilin-type N-terminal cleavage/methylation domain-containing protein